MSKRRSHTPNKAQILAIVAAHPGLSSDEIAEFSNVGESSTRHILQEFYARRLVYPLRTSGRIAKLWYVVSKSGNSESMMLPPTN